MMTRYYYKYLECQPGTFLVAREDSYVVVVAGIYDQITYTPLPVSAVSVDSTWVCTDSLCTRAQTELDARVARRIWRL